MCSFGISFLNTRQISSEYFKTCQILKVLLLQFAKFSCGHHNRARFPKVLMYGGGSVSQVIVLGEALCTPTLINVTRRIKTANPIPVCSSIYLDRERYLTMFYQRL